MSLSARYTAEQKAKKQAKKRRNANRPLTVAELEREGFKIARRVYVGQSSAYARANGLVVEREEYDPHRDVACQQMRVPYGKLERGGTAGQTQDIVIEAPSPLDPMDRRRDCLLSPAISAAQRETYRRNRVWSAGEGVE
jgi:hypothetical protein